MSFGWVFWHRACYGCLLCGCKLLYQGVSIQNLFGESREGEAQEVEETPLCANCVVEIEVDELGEGEVLRKGLRRIERADGGVTRQRYQLKGGTPPRPGPKQGGDGAGSDGNDPNTSKGLQTPETIWVNIFDPIDGPTFKPSPLKPIPWFMQRPNWVNVDTPRQSTSRNADLHLSLPPRDLTETSSDSAPSTICPSGPRTPVPSHGGSRSPPKVTTPVTSRSDTVVKDVKDAEELDYFSDEEPLRPLAFRRKPTYINEEPLQRPSSRLMGPRRRSETHASAYGTPPEFSEDYQREQQEATAMALPPRKPSTPAASQIALQLHRLMKAGTPAQSTDSVSSSRASGSHAGVSMSRAATEAKTDTSGSTTSLMSTGKNRSKEGSLRRSVGAELRRFFTGK